MIALAVVSFAVIALSPIYLSFSEVTAIDGSLLDESAETHLYADKGKNLAFMEQ